jgi:ubiquitin-protein ligase
MNDNSLINFLTRQLAEGQELAAKSNILRLLPGPGPLPQRYLAEFRCKGIVQTADGRIEECGLFLVGIYLPSDYLRRAEVPEVLTWVGPANIFHPNIAGDRGLICIGRFGPGSSLVSLLHQIFEVIVYRNFNPREDNCLNRAACAWARNNQRRFPTDPRPLKRPERLASAGGTKQ